jgi:hypothetical protein
MSQSADDFVKKERPLSAIREALREGEMSIHRAWLWSKHSPKTQPVSKGNVLVAIEGS